MKAVGQWGMVIGLIAAAQQGGQLWALAESLGWLWGARLLLAVCGVVGVADRWYDRAHHPMLRSVFFNFAIC